MTHAQILKAAIDKAIANGWRAGESEIVFTGEFYFGVDSIWFLMRDMATHEYIKVTFGINDLIFDHGFARALWGFEDDHIDAVAMHPEGVNDWNDSQEQPWFPAWKVRLVEMVVADHPIAYLGEHI